MIIEIGTSDFRTNAGKRNGIYIEPVKEHFDRLPECQKENVAISNYEGEIVLFYIPSEVIRRENLPNWVRGCNSVAEPHPTLVVNGWFQFCKEETVQVVRIKSIIDKYEVKEIHFLKIDTEGHDCIILNDFLDTVDIKPKTIQFENNVLSDPQEVKKVVNRLVKKGYNCKQSNFDMICELLSA